MTEQIAIRVPDGTKAKIRALSQSDETMTATLLRALGGLADSGESPISATNNPDLREQIAALTGRVAVLEKMPSPIGQKTAFMQKDESAEYPPAVRMMALWLKSQRKSNAEIRSAIYEACGRAPSLKHISTALRRWQ
ncbi:hypothetical protein [Thiobaca trueperi]|uniref:Uncharacterized protein n=2 Tax=Chromatiaceae TaxID=1046 RepID=A0A4R3MVS1_9GAMM|nr:hypothetical protein [Thiobaca trueperi]TCT20640.1 hypothetical protein EDC35_10579 [Thiobaca trueperi]